MEEDIIELKKSERTEEIQAIIDRMPTKMGLYITLFVFILVTVIIALGWTIRYPDVVTGQIVINANSAPIKLVANSSGKLLLNHFGSQDEVAEGDYIAVIQNAADIKDVRKVYDLIKDFNVNKLNKTIHFPRSVSLGEINTMYFAFLEAYHEFIDRHKQNLLLKQEEVLRQILTEQGGILKVSVEKLKMSAENVRFAKKFHQRDSTLFKKKVLTEADFDKSELNFIAARDNYQSMLNTIAIIREDMAESGNKIQQLAIQKEEEEKHTYLNMISTYTDLLDNLKKWEQKYAFKSPIKGKVEFSKFWTEDQFIQAGETVFILVPAKDKIIGQMTLPALGSGKVKVGQEVVVKLESYPYKEYGSIKGKVASISLTTNTLETESGKLETYLVDVDLPDGLKTNYGANLSFKFEIKGTGEIITNDRQLLERLFDNLKYALNK